MKVFIKSSNTAIKLACHVARAQPCLTYTAKADSKSVALIKPDEAIVCRATVDFEYELLRLKLVSDVRQNSFANALLALTRQYTETLYQDVVGVFCKHCTADEPVVLLCKYHIIKVRNVHNPVKCFVNQCYDKARVPEVHRLRLLT